MSEVLDQFIDALKKLPGLGARSAERIALHLLAEKPEVWERLRQAGEFAFEHLRRCERTGNLTDGELCPVYADPNRDRSTICVVESIPDLRAIEKARVFQGTYHVLHGRLSPIQGIGPEQLNFDSLLARLREDEVREVILALSNDIEGEATCHYIRDELVPEGVAVSRIGFGLPSGGGIPFADVATLQSSLSGRRHLD